MFDKTLLADVLAEFSKTLADRLLELPLIPHCGETMSAHVHALKSVFASEIHVALFGQWDALIARLNAAVAEGERNGWLPIGEYDREKHGARVIVGFDDCPALPMHQELGRYQGSSWANTYGNKFHGYPTHFFPLPPPPALP